MCKFIVLNSVHLSFLGVPQFEAILYHLLKAVTIKGDSYCLKKCISFLIFNKRKDPSNCISDKFTLDLQKIMVEVFMKTIPKHTKEKKVNRNSQVLPVQIVLGYPTAFFD